ncbi:MAG TPA: OmpA family protein [Syntrophales bacterium]|mgnify:CR=1 FL=1|jgi:hypothetical protein|nr:OmpA family protein [Pseudomonadota bacterium]HPX80388.1 OmpA family protein [Syntrophales bacterium]
MNIDRKTTIIALAIAFSLTIPGDVIAGAQVIKTSQAEYAYPSDVGKYLKSPSFILCAGPDCSTPTKKRPYAQVRVQRPATPMRISAQKVMPRSVATPPVRETVYFDFDSAALDKQEKEKIERIKHKAPAPESTAVITGYTDKIGSRSYNDKLALRRAETVNRQLGYEDAIVTGKGKCCYKDEKDNSMNRRVELEIKNKPQRAEADANVSPVGNTHVAPAPKPVLSPPAAKAGNS